MATMALIKKELIMAVDRHSWIDNQEKIQKTSKTFIFQDSGGWILQYALTQD